MFNKSEKENFLSHYLKGGVLLPGAINQTPQNLRRDKWRNYVNCSPSSRHEVGTESNLSFLNHFMGTYDMFLTDLELSTDYKSVALPIELWGRKKFFSWKYQIKQA